VENNVVRNKQGKKLKMGKTKVRRNGKRRDKKYNRLKSTKENEEDIFRKKDGTKLKKGKLKVRRSEKKDDKR
jgi:hypothetical protein